MLAIDVVNGQAVPTDIPAPPMRPGCVRIAVRAAGVNRADLVQRAGHYPPPPGASPILGLEVAGVITEISEANTNFRVGDPVVALLPGGGYAEQVVIETGCVLPIPASLDFADAASILEVWATAWLNLGRLAGLAHGERGRSVLLHAGASGVGTAAIQLCRELGHPTFVTVGSREKLDRCVALGADQGANRHDGPWREAVARWRPAGVNAILDPVGGGYLPDDIAIAAPDARIVLIGLMGGRSADINLGAVLSKRLAIMGSTLRARSVPFKAALLAELSAWAWPRFADRTLVPLRCASFALKDAQAAHDLVASNTTVGAVVLEVSAS